MSSFAFRSMSKIKRVELVALLYLFSYLYACLFDYTFECAFYKMLWAVMYRPDQKWGQGFGPTSLENHNLRFQDPRILNFLYRHMFCDLLLWYSLWYVVFVCSNASTTRRHEL